VRSRCLLGGSGSTGRSTICSHLTCPQTGKPLQSDPPRLIEKLWIRIRKSANCLLVDLFLFC
jgi:hypothetical protein